MLHLLLGGTPPARRTTYAAMKLEGKVVTDKEPFPVRRALLLGVLVQPAFYGLGKALGGGYKGPVEQPAQLEGGKEFDVGDAVTQPGLETELIEVLEAGGPGVAIVPGLVSQLEAAAGSQLGAAAGQGRWVIPWVGGWERVWANQEDSSFLGGPTKTSFGGFGQTFSQVSCRQFIYGPGDGGITVEYLHQVPGAGPNANKLLLTRQGNVQNLGNLEFKLDFPDRMDEYEVRPNVASKDGRIGDALASGQKLDGGAERAPLKTALLRSSYLSERLWIVRDVEDASKAAVFVRTETKSVFDRRGLVADGQLKPPEKDEIRFGGLLFGESQQDYANWDVKEGQRLKAQEKLFVR